MLALKVISMYAMCRHTFFPKVLFNFELNTMSDQNTLVSIRVALFNHQTVYLISLLSFHCCAPQVLRHIQRRLVRAGEVYVVGPTGASVWETAEWKTNSVNTVSILVWKTVVGSYGWYSVPLTL